MRAPGGAGHPPECGCITTFTTSPLRTRPEPGAIQM
jgi:hypothetical protein